MAEREPGEASLAPMKARASSRTPNLLDVAEGFLDFFA
jgi:hypothetical protein